MFKYLRNLFSKDPQYSNSNNKALECIYTDRLGNRYYQYKNFLEAPAIRTVASETAIRFAEMNINEKTLKLAVEEMIAAGNKSDLMRVFGILYEIKIRLEMLAESTCLLELSAILFPIEHENPDTIRQDEMQYKIDLWQNDPEAKAFFLTAPQRYIERLCSIVPKDLNGFLNEAADHKKRLDLMLTYLPKENDTKSK